MTKNKAPKNPIAQEMARMRWRKTSAEDRTIHARMAATARGAKYARERTDAMLRMPKGIAARLVDVSRSRLSKYSFYYTVGYELGLAQLDRTARTRMLRALKTHQQTLERERHALEREENALEDQRFSGKLDVAAYIALRKRLVLKSRPMKRQRQLLDMTLASLRAPVLERLLLDREKLAAWDEGGATRTLRSVLEDASVIAPIPSPYRPALLYGLRAGALGEAMAINEFMKKRGVGLLD